MMNMFKDPDGFICKKCGNVFDPYDLVGDGCPECGSEDYEEAVKCAACGEWIEEAESVHGYCESCIKKAADLEKVLDFCDEDEKTEVDVNFAAVSVLKSLGFDINQILIGYVKDLAKNFPFADRVKKAVEDCVTIELDTQHYMEFAKDMGV